MYLFRYTLLIFFLFLWGCSAYKHCLINPYIQFKTPADELNLLDDEASYYEEEELYNADTLTRKRLVKAYHNYGDHRYAIYSAENGKDTDRIIHYQKVNDTFAIQTVTSHRYNDPSVDSTLVWWKKGRIRRATIARQGNLRTDYVYEYVKGLLLKKTIISPGPDKKETWFSYKGDRLSMVNSQSQSIGLQEFIYQYSDSLTTESYTEKKDSSIIRGRSELRFNKCGNILSGRSYIQLRGESGFTLYQSQDYVYFPDGGYQGTFMQNTTDDVSMMEFHPKPFSTERWTWKGIDQVWVKSRIKF